MFQVLYVHLVSWSREGIYMWQERIQQRFIRSVPVIVRLLCDEILNSQGFTLLTLKEVSNLKRIKSLQGLTCSYCINPALPPNNESQIRLWPFLEEKKINVFTQCVVNLCVMDCEDWGKSILSFIIFKVLEAYPQPLSSQHCILDWLISIFAERAVEVQLLILLKVKIDGSLDLMELVQKSHTGKKDPLWPCYRHADIAHSCFNVFCSYYFFILIKHSSNFNSFGNAIRVYGYGCMDD